MQKFFLKIKDRWWFWILALFLVPVVERLVGSMDISDINNLARGASYILNVKVPIFSALLSILISYFTYKFINKIKIDKRRLKILKATYGRDLHLIDITNELNNAIQDDKLIIVISNNIAGDPLIGYQKMATVLYEFDGHQVNKYCKEGETLVLP